MAGGVGTRSERQREAAPQPEPVQGLRPGFIEPEAAEFGIGDPSSKGFGRVLRQFWRSGPDHQITGGGRRLISQHAQHGEQIGTTLDLVDHDQSLPPAQRQHRIRQAGLIVRILQIIEGGLARLPVKAVMPTALKSLRRWNEIFGYSLQISWKRKREMRGSWNKYEKAGANPFWQKKRSRWPPTNGS